MFFEWAARGWLYGTRITLMTHVTRTDRQQPSNQVENFKLTFAKGVKKCVGGVDCPDR